MRNKADGIQSLADRKDMKKLHDALKTVYDPNSSGTTPRVSADTSDTWDGRPNTSIVTCSITRYLINQQTTADQIVDREHYIG